MRSKTGTYAHQTIHACNIKLVHASVKALITMMCRTITEKNARERLKMHVKIVVWGKIRKTKSLKTFKKV